MLLERCDLVVRAVEDRDSKAFEDAFQGVVAEMDDVPPAELTAALERLAPLLLRLPLGIGNNLAVLLGAMVELGAEPVALVDPLVERVLVALDRAAAFPAMWAERVGGDEPPDPDDESQIDLVMDTFGDAEETALAAEAWFVTGNWLRPMLTLLQRREIRLILPSRDELTRATDALRDRFSGAHWLYGLLRVVDDEPLVVLHRPTGRGYRVTIGGIGDNFQLHTLLADALIGDPARGLIPGERPAPAWVAAATDGDVIPAEHVHGQFELADAYGKRVWHEGRPEDIPPYRDVRVLVLVESTYDRSWNAGRLYPFMLPRLTVDAIMSPDEAAGWLRALPEA